MNSADVFIGLSKPNLVNAKMIKSMNVEPIIFAMANPVPEVMPEIALKAGASIVGTGRSDYPNQINNALVFPGIFKGFIDNGIKKVTPKMKLEAAKALAKVVKKPTKNRILPKVTSLEAVQAIAKSVK